MNLLSDTDPSDIYVKEPYVINVRACYDILKQKTELLAVNEEKKQNALEILKNEFKFFCSQISIKKKLSYSEDNKQFELGTNHQSFYKWLAFDLTLQKTTTIQSMLTAYSVGKLGSVVNFNNQIEHRVPLYMAFLIFDHQPQDFAVQHWISQNNYPNDSFKDDVKSNLFIDESVKSKIKISPEAQDFLKSILINYLHSEEQRLLFTGTIEGRFIKVKEKVFLNLKANLFCDLIKQLYDNNRLLITSNKKQINEWICNNFLFNKKGMPSPITTSYCSQLLSGREEPSVGRRFVINDLTVK
jgi:hypothetical protein